MLNYAGDADNGNTADITARVSAKMTSKSKIMAENIDFSTFFAWVCKSPC